MSEVTVVRVGKYGEGYDSLRVFANEEAAWRWIFRRYHRRQPPEIDRRNSQKTQGFRALVRTRWRWVLVTRHKLLGKRKGE